MIANRALIVRKCAGVINAYAERAAVPLREAFDVFYKSNLYREIRDGVSDMHCRSDGYLAEELSLEIERASHGSHSPPSSSMRNCGTHEISQGLPSGSAT